MGVEVVGQRLFGGRAGLDADRGAVKLLGGLDAEFLRNDEALAVIVGHGHEYGTLAGVARHRPSGVAGEHVDFAGLQGGEALRRAERNVLDLVGVAENGGGHGAADVDVEAAPLALAVGAGKARSGRVDAAEHVAALLDVVKRDASDGRHGNGTCGKQCGNGQKLHLHFEFLPFGIELFCLCPGTSRESRGRASGVNDLKFTDTPANAKQNLSHIES